VLKYPWGFFFNNGDQYCQAPIMSKKQYKSIIQVINLSHTLYFKSS